MSRRVVWVSFDVIGRACLETTATAGADVVGIVTLPGPIDANRSGMCSFDDVAHALGADLLETRDVNADQTIEWVRARRPDMIFVVGWSQLVRQSLIDLAPDGVFGMHPTLLPRHRGRAPIPWAILSGLAKTGVTLFEIVDPTADSGPIVSQIEIPIAQDETAQTLYDLTFDAHLALLKDVVPQLLAGTAPRISQDDGRGSSWPKRTPADGIIDWDTRAPYLYDWVRAQTRPYPGAFTFLGDERLVVWRARPVAYSGNQPSGTVIDAVEEGVVIACGEGGLLLEEIQLEDAAPLFGAEIGTRLPARTRLG